MTPKELGELGHLEAATPVVDADDFPPIEADELLEPGHRKSINLLREFGASGPDASKSKRIVFDFFAKPVRIEGDGRAERLIVERTVLDETGAAKGTGEIYEVPASLIVTSIGYQTPRIDGVPYDERGGKFANEHGKIGEGLYAVGWARRGPTGTIGTNRPDGYEVAEQVASVMEPGSNGGKPGGAGLQALLGERGIEPTSFDDWRKIEAAEVAAARPGSPREKFVRHGDWLKILGR
jgi:ferredoxin--NADP+ reductase